MFSEYPYTNKDDLNLDYILKKIKETVENMETFVALNTIKYADPILWDIESQYATNTIVIDGATGNAYISTKPVPSGVTLDNSDYWTGIFNYQSLIDAVNERVDAVEATVSDLSTEVETLNTVVEEKRGTVIANMILDMKIPSVNAMQGGCYTENGNFVYYENIIGTDTGYLVCVNMDSMTERWRSPLLTLYHGNAIAFRPIDRKLYIANCYAASDTQTLLKSISVVDYDSHNTIETTILSPARGGIYSLAYDVDNDKFYSMNYRGTVSGDTNVLFEYNGIFETVNREILIDDYTVNAVPQDSTQGVQYVKNGVAYYTYYAPDRFVAGFDIETGERKIIACFDNYVNGYRNMGELQFITGFDDRVFIGVMTANSGIPGNVFPFIAEIGLYKNILVNDNLPRGSVISDLSDRLQVTLQLSKTDLTPTCKNGIFYSLSDCIRYQKTIGVMLVINVANSADPDTLFIGHIQASGFHGIIKPADTTKLLDVGQLWLTNSDYEMQYCRFVETMTVSPVNANLIINGRSRVSLQSCTFEEVDGNTHALYVYQNGEVTADFMTIATSYYHVGATFAKLRQRPAKVGYINRSVLDINQYTNVDEFATILLAENQTVSVNGTLALDIVRYDRIHFKIDYMDSEIELQRNDLTNEAIMRIIDCTNSFPRMTEWRLNTATGVLTLIAVKTYQTSGVVDGSTITLVNITQ